MSRRTAASRPELLSGTPVVGTRRPTSFEQNGGAWLLVAAVVMAAVAAALLRLLLP
jgi:hypothetical protein